MSANFSRVHRKALAALAALLVAAALGACGGGEETTGTTASEGSRPAAAPEDVQRRAEEVKEERRQESQPSGDSGSGASGEDPDAPPAATDHRDSGGGSTQFRNEAGGDNSIQNFGQEASAGERERAAAVLHGYLDSRAARRWDEACSYLSAETVATMEQFGASSAQGGGVDSCAEVLEALAGSTSAETLRELAQADVGSLRAQDGRGFILYHGPRGVDYAIAVVEEGGEWKLSSPEATPLI